MSSIWIRPHAILRGLAPAAPFICRRCLALFSTSATASAGHNKWSKTKHIKAAMDKKKMIERQSLTKLIAMYSRMYGADVNFNPQLANAVATATKASVPKALIEGAIAKGQGRSLTGSELEAMVIEVLIPPDIALLVDVETDNKIRTLQEIRDAIKKNKGVVGSTAFYFAKRGRAVFKSVADGPMLSDVLEEALSHEEVQDVEELPDGSFSVWTEPTALMAITKALAAKLDIKVLESDLVWAPNEDTMTTIDSPEVAKDLGNLASALSEFSEVKAVYANARRGSLEDKQWSLIEENINA